MASKKLTPVKKAFITRLRAARIAAGFSTVRAFADQMGLEEARVGQWERGHSEPDHENLIKIQRATGASLDFLIAGLKPVTHFENAGEIGTEQATLHMHSEKYVPTTDVQREKKQSKSN